MGALRADEQKLLDAPTSVSTHKTLDALNYTPTETPDQALESPKTTP